MSPLEERLTAPRAEAVDERRWPRWWPLLPGALVAVLAAWLVTRAPVRVPTPRPAVASAFSPAQKRELEAMVGQYILAHPEIIPQAMTALQTRAITHLIATNRGEIERPFAGAWSGAKDADVTLVEFFDYACPYCRASKGDLDRLLASDPRLKIVYRDIPIISAASEEAALASLSAARQGRYRAFYEAMFDDAARVSHEKIVANVRAARLNELQTARALTTKSDVGELKKNLELARALGLTGTPAFIVGDQILIGAKTLGELRDAVHQARIRKSA